MSLGPILPRGTMWYKHILTSMWNTAAQKQYNDMVQQHPTHHQHTHPIHCHCCLQSHTCSILHWWSSRVYVLLFFYPSLTELTRFSFFAHSQAALATAAVDHSLLGPVAPLEYESLYLFLESLGDIWYLFFSLLQLPSFGKWHLCCAVNSGDWQTESLHSKRWSCNCSSSSHYVIRSSNIVYDHELLGREREQSI